MVSALLACVLLIIIIVAVSVYDSGCVTLAFAALLRDKLSLVSNLKCKF